MARRSVTFLWAGVAAPIVFTTVYLVDGATRTGYDPLRHQVSLLALGERGWLMTVNFLLTGVLLLVFAAGVRAWLRDGRGAVATPVAIAIAGVGVLLAGIFPTQPLFGYPPGAPEGMAIDVTPASVMHLLGAFLFLFGLIAAALSFAVRSWRGGSRGWAVGSLAIAALVFVTFGASGGGPSGQLLFPDISGLLQRVALISGMGWVLALALLAISGSRNATDLPD